MKPVALADTNVLVDIWSQDPDWLIWSGNALQSCMERGPVGINAVVFAEVSVRFPNLAACEADLADLALQMLDIPNAALFLAGRAFLDYRKRGGQRTGVLPDFFIGAHAVTAGLPLITRDAARYKTYFPRIKLIAP